MTCEEIKRIIQTALPEATVRVEEQQGKYVILVIAAAFSGLSSLERQKLIYAPLTPHITSGAIHAVSLHGYSPDEQPAD